MTPIERAVNTLRAAGLDDAANELAEMIEAAPSSDHWYFRPLGGARGKLQRPNRLTPPAMWRQHRPPNGRGEAGRRNSEPRPRHPKRGPPAGHRNKPH